MSSAVAQTSSFDQIDVLQKSKWDIKQLVAALEDAPLYDVMKLLNVQPIKWGINSTRRGHLATDVARSVAQTRLEAGEVEVLGAQKSGDIDASFSPYSGDEQEQVQSLLETTVKLKMIEEVKKLSDSNIEVNLAPRDLRDHLEELTSKYLSNFYLVNLGKLVDKFFLWRRSIPRVQPFYAVKSNPDLEICRSLHTLGTGFDCASKAELEQILEFPGIDPENIIFANPCKQIEHILYAKKKGVKTMTFDNSSEIDKIYKYFPDSKLVLRLLPDDSHSLMPFGSKFGASFLESIQLIEKCYLLGLDLIGVSFHVGSGCYSPVAWVEALKLSRSIFDEAAKFGYDMNFLDIGGGFPGSEDGVISLKMIASDINSVIDDLFGPHVRVISEPGRFFCSESVTLACVIVSKRERTIGGAGATETDRESQYYLSDGIYGSMNCVVFDHVTLEPILLSADSDSRPLLRTTMWGPTCDSIDVLVKNIQFPQSHLGEWVYFRSMGAYTSSAASKFNGFLPPPPYYTLNIFSDY